MAGGHSGAGLAKAPGGRRRGVKPLPQAGTAVKRPPLQAMAGNGCGGKRSNLAMQMNPPPTWQQRLAERARPSGPVVMHQRWAQLLFLHWKWDPVEVQRSLPPGLTVDTFDGAAWLGVVPLFMRDVRPRFVPAVPAISDFLEVNVRTYVYDALGRPGLYFYSLDCNQPLAVETARRLMHLRYEHAAMAAEVDGDGVVSVTSERTGTVGQARFRYQGLDIEATQAKEESLEFFLIERYRLFATDDNGERLMSVRVCHAPYRIRSAIAFEWSPVPLRLNGFDPGERGPEHLCVAETVDVEVFAPEKVE